jgi:hypothetical protein
MILGRVIPHSDGKVFGVTLRRMKIKQSMELTSRELISSAKGRSS